MSLPQLRHWFERCMEQPAATRADWLTQQVADPDLRARLQRLLAADAAEDGFLDAGAAERLNYFRAHDSGFAPVDLSGQRYGLFRLVRLLGRGGQATVYLAEREDADFRQTVAVKLLHRGLHDATEHRLFRRERDLLARLEHPDIARLIDAGVSAEGVPYLVMEYIDGVTIDTWCEAQQLDWRACGELFVRLCLAVDTAHRALIVHRDLKPSNVLVTRAGQIKVLDFGIARLLDDEGEEATVTALRRLTPGYAAPEQVRGLPPTLATDVYALGIVFAELLGGRREMRRQTPVLPAAVPRDLHWIIGRACADEAERRYRSAAELSEDVRRWLAGAPVQAHPPSRGYRLRKFAGRHRIGVATATLFVLTLVSATVISLVLWYRAEREAHRANEAAAVSRATQEFLVSVFDSALGETPQAEQPSVNELLERGLHKLRTSGDTPPAVRQELLARFVEIYRVQTDHGRADALAAELIEHARTHFGPASREYAQSLLEAARVARRRTQWDKAGRYQLEALPILERGAPAGIEYATALADYGGVLSDTARYDEAGPVLNRAGTLFAALCAQGSAQGCRDELAMGIAAAVNTGSRGDFAVAYEQLKSLLPRVEQRLGPNHLVSMQVHYNLAAAANFIGDARASEHAQVALARSLALGPTGSDMAVQARNVLALVDTRYGRYAAATQQYEQIIATMRQRFPDGHQDIARYRANLAEAWIMLGRHDAARAEINAAHAWYESETPRNRFELARVGELQARLALAESRADAAFENVSAALQLRRETPDQRTDRFVDALNLLARIELARQRPAQALAAAREADLLASSVKKLKLIQRVETVSVLAAAGEAVAVRERAAALWREALAAGETDRFQRCRVALKLYTWLAEILLVQQCGNVLDELPEDAALKRDYRRALGPAP